MRRKRLAAVIAGTAAVTAGTVGVAGAVSGDDEAEDRPIPASGLKQAERAALQETGGGEVTETEVGDEDSMYEVEVTLEDGTQVDVQLDDAFRVVGTERDTSDSDD